MSLGGTGSILAGGQALAARVQALDGAWIELPARLLRAPVGRDGSQGWFGMEGYARHRLKAFRQFLRDG